MADATLSQWHRLEELILRENDSFGFLQNLHGNWGAVQRIGRGEVTQAEFIEALTHIDRTTNPYASEKVQATYSYPKGYRPNSVKEQVKRLLAYLPFDASQVVALAKSGGSFELADGLCVIPKPSVLAEILGLKDLWDNFGILTEQGPFAALATSRKFANYRAGQLGPDRYRLAESAKAALMQLEADQPEGDLLVFPAQTGKLYAGFSSRNAKWDIEHVEGPCQFPLPAYVVGWILFCNPHRLQKFEHLIIDCPGDEYCLGPGGEFDVVLCFDFRDDELYVDGRWTDGPLYCCGSGSGFVQQ